MRFTALFWSAFGLAVNAAAVNKGAMAWKTYNTSTHTPTILTSTIQSVTFPMRVVSARDPPPADPMSLPCLSGSTTHEQYPETMSCRGPYPSGCTRSTSTVFLCMPITTSSSSVGNQFGGRTMRWVADFAQPTSTIDALSSITVAPELEQAAATDAFAQPLCSWDPVNYKYVCPKMTAQPLCSWDTSKYVYVCPTPAPTKVARAFTQPLCSWDPVHYKYICPKPTPAPTGKELCSWDPMNYKYICPEPNPANKLEKKDCPEGVGMCIPEGEQPENHPCEDGVEMCIPAGETPVVTPKPKVARTVSVHDPHQPKPQVTGGLPHFTIPHVTIHTTTKASAV